MSIARKMKRKELKARVSSKNMRRSWEMLQRDKYGKDYKKVCNKKGRYLIEDEVEEIDEETTVEQIKA